MRVISGKKGRRVGGRGGELEVEGAVGWRESLHDGSLTATYGWLLKRPSATYGWSLKLLATHKDGRCKCRR
jgi:hypothetical protein